MSDNWLQEKDLKYNMDIIVIEETWGDNNIHLIGIKEIYVDQTHFIILYNNGGERRYLRTIVKEIRYSGRITQITGLQ